MMMVSATPLSPLLIILALPIGIVVSIVGAECAFLLRQAHWTRAKH